MTKPLVATMLIDISLEEQRQENVARRKIQSAIAAFAQRLTEGENQIACSICCFSRMESAANPEHYSCGLTDRPCPIRKAANLTGDSNDR